MAWSQSVQRHLPKVYILTNIRASRPQEARRSESDTVSVAENHAHSAFRPTGSRGGLQDTAGDTCMGLQTPRPQYFMTVDLDLDPSPL